MMLNGKKTYLIAAAGAVLAGIEASGVVMPPWLYAVLGSLGLATLRHGVAADTLMAPVRRSGGDAETTTTTVLVLAAALALGACAAPEANQGNAGQGGSNTAPVVSVVVRIGGDGHQSADATSAPTAAPSAASDAAATQPTTQTTDVKPAVGDSAIKALTPKPDITVIAPPKPETPEPKPPE